MRARATAGTSSPAARFRFTQTSPGSRSNRLLLAASFVGSSLAGWPLACTPNYPIAMDPPEGGTHDGARPPSDAGAESDAAGGRDAGADTRVAPSCDNGAGRAELWQEMDEANFRPWHYARLDLGSPEAGITLAQAEAVNCAGIPADASALVSAYGRSFFPTVSTDAGACDPCGHCYGAIAWGESQEVTLIYDTATHLVAGLSLNSEFAGHSANTGVLTFTNSLDPFGMRETPHKYRMEIGFPVLKDGKPLTIDWANPGMPGLWEIYIGITQTFTHEYEDGGKPPGYGCTSRDACVYYPSYEGSSYFGIPAVGLYFQFALGSNVLTQVYTYAAGNVQVPTLKDDAGMTIFNDASYATPLCGDGGS
jgi:hypothetical protein